MSTRTKIPAGTLVAISGTVTPSGRSVSAYVKSNRGARYKLETDSGEIWFCWREDFRIDPLDKTSSTVRR